MNSNKIKVGYAICGSFCTFDKSIYALRETQKAYVKMLHVQGYDVDVDAEIAKIDALPYSYDAILAYGETLMDLPVRKDFGYTEPYHLEDIRAERPENRVDKITPAQKELELQPVILKDKVYGGVFGRIAGCILGKPFEMNWTAKEIRNFLEAANAYPLDNYAPAYSPYS